MKYLFISLAVTICCAASLGAQEAPAAAQSEFGIYTHAKIKGPYLAMTFDDGPSADYTPRLLDMLKARHLKATFFLIGKNVEAHPEIVRRILAEGHEIGDHTWDHPQLSKLTEQQATDEIEKTREAIKKACGYSTTLLRPPYGALNKAEHVWIPAKLHLNVIDWSVDTEDWKNPGSAVVTQRVLAGARPGAIILQHDIHKETVDAMPAALDGLVKKGYKLVTVSELIKMEKQAASTKPTNNSSKAGTADTVPVKNALGESTTK